MSKLQTQLRKSVAHCVFAIRNGLGVLTIATLGLASAASAQNFATDVGSSERINLAGQLGTLSQRIIASACNLNAGIAVRESNAVLQISANQFERINDALLYGNRGFGILGEESRPRTLRAVSELADVWQPLQREALTAEVGANQSDMIASIAVQSVPVLDEVNILVSEITAQYADPVALLHADALLIDIAGRQRMLAQRMSKNVCLITSGIEVEAAREELAATIELFDTSLSALRNGLESVGVRPPPTKRIEEGLQFVVDEWTAIRPVLDATLIGTQLDENTRTRLFGAFLGMEARMNNVVFMYDKNSKLGL
ncbi:type IV pili methyl-accepting chemotaxis transducer N-terminal domain-containing protein [Yoonia sediminilitoris]|uniref:PilJ/NarX-like methyl-accepting chemotaxis transducer n=1 Tax=Yoonia sediminilitoris TaxID=1286148 RepID=A0A2T6KB23_9RHOB|nr:type IV pili methyl-accepting chemotaxis transducer N-terminal domain-containing protein [Yoonia sediminilitoris]PUB12072.1 PilJ/NarX-like methyl-accepting chemotaxis transducer [Yoonia sediminilitoris]RCW92899.1 PilJ/NarX-like methyl-accepting chemotaxis transducer [Yoonia sediminilitoris]